MMGLSFGKGRDAPVNILCLGAHSDDIEIGCGGTLLELRKAALTVRFHWVVFSAAGRRAREAQKGAALFTEGCEKQVAIKDFRDGFLPYSGSAVKDAFEDLKAAVDPDLIFTHWQGDAHQDHRLISELTWNTFRNHLILEYEIPKYDGDMGRPNVFMPLELSSCERKVDHLFAAFESQCAKPWFARETFLGLMRLRGMESNAASGYAEAFHGRKLVLSSLA
jgi:LmbE family N-acetylglucosaminyl deacetylase